MTQKRHSWSPVHLPCWTSKPCYKLKSYEGFLKKRQQQPLELKSTADTSLPIFTLLPLPSLINGLKHLVFEHRKHYIYTEVTRIILLSSQHFSKGSPVTSIQTPGNSTHRIQTKGPSRYIDPLPNLLKEALQCVQKAERSGSCRQAEKCIWNHRTLVGWPAVVQSLL